MNVSHSRNLLARLKVVVFNHRERFPQPPCLFLQLNCRLRLIVFFFPQRAVCFPVAKRSSDLVSHLNPSLRSRLSLRLFNYCHLKGSVGESYCWAVLRWLLITSLEIFCGCRSDSVFSFPGWRKATWEQEWECKRTRHKYIGQWSSLQTKSPTQMVQAVLGPSRSTFIETECPATS